VGYFAQNQAEYLDGEITLLETMQNAATDTNRAKVRDMLGSFLFRGDDVEKKVKVLSGGERNRLALCKLLLQPINVLVMDEPTNHLDIKSKNVLKAALQKFEERCCSCRTTVISCKACPTSFTNSKTRKSRNIWAISISSSNSATSRTCAKSRKKTSSKRDT
jgi:ABC-type multidrug transport system ATPase subunit